MLQSIQENKDKKMIAWIIKHATRATRETIQAKPNKNKWSKKKKES